MLKLMKLELKKLRIKKFLTATLIAILLMIALIILTSYGPKPDNEVPFTSFHMAFDAIDSLVRPIFIVFADVLLSKVIIAEYKNKTITLLFMYPISRRKIFVSKLLIVVIFTFLAIFLSDILISSILFGLDSINNIISEKLTVTILVNRLAYICLISIYSAGISLIPLYFGMRKKSAKATIVSSIIVVTILFGSYGNGKNVFSLGSIIPIPISLALVGVAIAYFTIRKIEDVDVIWYVKYEIT